MKKASTQPGVTSTPRSRYGLHITLIQGYYHTCSTSRHHDDAYSTGNNDLNVILANGSMFAVVIQTGQSVVASIALSLPAQVQNGSEKKESFPKIT
ncbi:unnamed protein product [Acanthoscelides obtectus]|uniref:Uncharacterized protein n=1 Tax=Acanthoscelides obtectus TaxID=200917 RepID=A0A9P0K5X6_ACAOB|nr:unnamed protein product [Acanthoscelides obtectus]CAK1648053.1 hypothetical protein AOBTE_LOCUS15522 [Acanthoscelides obtectus]